MERKGAKDFPEEGHSEQEGERPRRGPKSVLLPPELAILRQARMLAADRNVRISTLAQTVAEDPVITLELLRVANATFFSGDRPAISTVHTAVIRLGSQLIIETLEELGQRPQFSEPELFCEFENLRSISRRISGVSQIIASVAHRDIAEIAQTTGLMTYVGHMIACAYLGGEYVELAQNRARTAIAYRIQQDHSWDLNKVMLEYLRNHGLSSALFFGLDRELKCKTPAQSALRFVIASAVEMVEAFEANKWDKYDPSRNLPSKSSIRLLQLRDEQYAGLYEAVDDYFHGRGGTEPEAEEVPPVAAESPDEEQLGSGSRKKLVASERQEGPTVVLRRNGFDRVGHREPTPTLILTRHGFGGYDMSAQPTNYIEPEPDKLEEEAQSLSADAQKVLNLIGGLCNQSRTAQDLLGNLLGLLITDARFVRAALIVLTEHRQTADIHTAVGEGFSDGEKIVVKDPLSPLALCLTKIKSFNAQTIEDLLSPFGISSYAISPIRVRHDQPVVLYADCGFDRPLPMEARKVFRLVVGLLNQTLPRLPGGLPERGAHPLPELSHDSLRR